MQVRPLRASALALLLLLTACGTPPHKEMDQAHGAIDAARAAGAERYAAEEFTAATASLTAATQAVDQRDYRLALNHALESREHAQNAARISAETQGKLRAEVDRATQEVIALLAQAAGRLTTAEKSRIPRRVITDARRAIATAKEEMQKAGVAVEAGDVPAAQAVLSSAKQRLSDVIAGLDAALRAQNARRRR
ncbi:MAG: DUF4398 domain-containing protein [Vicinamibacterales bacterium]